MNYPMYLPYSILLLSSKKHVFEIIKPRAPSAEINQNVRAVHFDFLKFRFYSLLHPWIQLKRVNAVR